MRTKISRMAVVALLAATASATMGDVVYLRSGGKIEGRIIDRSDTAITVDLGGGQMTLQRSSILRIDEGRSKLDDYDERRGALADDDIDGWVELAQWASSASLATQSSRAWEHVLTLDPDHAQANRALGRVEFEGRWVSEEEAYRAQGYVKFEGQWMPPDEREAILRDRELRAATERVRVQAEAQARAAEARAAEAEARAREAEAESEGVIYGVPVYWSGWGPGYWYNPQVPNRPRPTPLPGQKPPARQPRSR